MLSFELSHTISFFYSPRMVVICLGPICLPVWPLIVFAVRPIWDRIIPAAAKNWLSTNWDGILDYLCRRRTKRSPSRKSVAPVATEIRRIQSDAEYAVLLAESHKLPVLIKFTAEFCGPCKLIDPTFKELSSEFRGMIVFAELDIEQLDELALRLGVPSIPAFHVVKDGSKIDQMTGANVEKLRSLVKKHSKFALPDLASKKTR